MIVDIPTDLAQSVAFAIRHLADHYRSDIGHSPDGIASLRRAAERMDLIANGIDDRLTSIQADQASARTAP